MAVRIFKDAEAFRTALESRIKNISLKEGVDIMRLRRQFTFDRFLCRVLQPPESWITVFTKLSKECELEMDLGGAFTHLKDFYEKITP